MHLSLPWLNDYLSPGDVTPAAAEDLLTHLGFPIESWDGSRFDLEVTSNRGDLLCHLGAAREIAAKTARQLKLPPAEVSEDPAAGPIAESLTLINDVPGACPLFTARVIRGVKVGPSPAWLRERLESVGQRSINNIVDVTNFLNFELGNPCHAFDLAKLSGRTLHIRWAKDQEPLTTLDSRKRTLRPDELVVADAERAQSLAGVIGGGDSEVSDATTDVVLEVATWSPAVVRRAARRHGVRTDASHRFERIVDARTLEYALNRGAALIAEVSGGRICPGILTAGAPLATPTRIRFRPRRCAALIGIDPGIDTIVRTLHAVGVETAPIGRGGEELACTPPPHRPDLSREADLIEEVARLLGLDAVPLQEAMRVTVRPPQQSEAGRRALSSLLTGMGFFEAVTFSFTSPREAALFVPQGLEIISVDDARRGEEPTLRPSVLTGLLTSRRKNQHAQVQPPGGVRMFEVADVFAQRDRSTVEHTNVGLIMDAAVKGKAAAPAELQHAVRCLRGVIESIAAALGGASAALTIEPAVPHAPAFTPGAYAQVSMHGLPLGYMGLLSPAVQANYDLATPVVAAELKLATLLSAYPPRGSIAALPEFPGIERDISIVVDESVPWNKIQSVVHAGRQLPFEDVRFVGTFRGQQIGKGRKSVTLRLSFRDAVRTLRHEEVDGPVAGVVEALRAGVGAELRG